MRLRFGSSYWLARNSSRLVRSYGRQHGALDVDVAIVGGGFTGSLIAYVFATAGLRVALVERGRIGYGSAGASTALLMQSPDRYLSELTARYGRKNARTVWRLSRTAVRDLARLLRPMRCGLHSVPSLHVAVDDADGRDLRRDLRARHAAGLGGRLLQRDALRAKTGIHGAAAILMSGDAIVDPYRATVALARAADRAGALVFERTEAVAVKGDRQGAVVTTPHGKVACQYTVIATGFATPAFKPLRARFKMSTTYVIATEPIAARDQHAIGAMRAMFWDAQRPYHYCRWTDDGRILFGGEDRPVPRTRRARRAAIIKSAASLERKLREFYPDLKMPGVAHAWDGLFATTPDGLPYIGPHRRFPRQLFALGYGARRWQFG